MILTSDQLREAADVLAELTPREQPIRVQTEYYDVTIGDLIDTIVDMNERIAKLENAMREEGR